GAAPRATDRGQLALRAAHEAAAAHERDRSVRRRLLAAPPAPRAAAPATRYGIGGRRLNGGGCARHLACSSLSGLDRAVDVPVPDGGRLGAGPMDRADRL